MQPLVSQSELNAFCERVSGSDFLAVDTEFLRERTYYPQLCLVQIAGESDAAVIDPLAPGIDLKPVFELLAKPGLPKVFHACRQDIEIFYMLSGKIPEPIFDTQVAAAVCGFGESVSYETLVNEIVRAELDKSSRFTDWSTRPLSEKQLAYALSDVTHLRVIYKALVKKITDGGRTLWIAEELAHLGNPALYKADPENAWKRLKFGNMRPKHLAALKLLAKWREIEAREKNVPRGRIVKDETLVELAANLPRKEADLTRLRGIGRHMSSAHTQAIFDCIEKALTLAPADYPQLKQHRRLPEHISGAITMLQFLLKICADQHGIAAPMIAGRDDLEMIALGQSESPALSGWRYDIFGHQAQMLMQGKLTLSLDPKTGKVVLEEHA